MPSERSFSSIRAENHRRVAEERGGGTGAAAAGSEPRHGGHDGAVLDSEDEEMERSDGEGSDVGEDGETSRRRSHGPAPAAAAAAAGGSGAASSASGLRGGAGSKGVDEDEFFSCGEEDEYDEHEDFDDEYDADRKLGDLLKTTLASTSNPEEEGVEESERKMEKDQEEESAPPDHGVIRKDSPGCTNEGRLDKGEQHNNENPNEKHTKPDSRQAGNEIPGFQDEEDSEKTEQLTNKPSIDNPQPSTAPGNGGAVEGYMASQTNRNLRDRTPQPYTFASIQEQETVRIIRPSETPTKAPTESGRKAQTIHRRLKAMTDTLVDPKGKARARETAKAEPQGKERARHKKEKAQHPDMKTAKAATPSEFEPGEPRARAQRRPPIPKQSATHIYEERIPDNYQPGGAFPQPLPRSGRFYRTGRFNSFGRWDNPYGTESTRSGSDAPRSGAYESGNVPQGRYGGVPSPYQRHNTTTVGDNKADGAEPPAGKSKPRRRWIPTPEPSSDESSSSESSSGESSSDESSKPPRARRRQNLAGTRPAGKPNRELSSSPPPRRRARRNFPQPRRTTTSAKQRPGRNPSPPPEYSSVDSVKEAPPNYYATLGIELNATKEESVHKSKN